MYSIRGQLSSPTAVHSRPIHTATFYRLGHVRPPTPLTVHSTARPNGPGYRTGYNGLDIIFCLCAGGDGGNRTPKPTPPPEPCPTRTVRGVGVRAHRQHLPSSVGICHGGLGRFWAGRSWPVIGDKLSMESAAAVADEVRSFWCRSWSLVLECVPNVRPDLGRSRQGSASESRATTGRAFRKQVAVAGAGSVATASHSAIVSGR
jgi:hypothetical protein